MSENPNKQMENEANKWSNISNILASHFNDDIELTSEDLMAIGLTDADLESSSESDIDFSEFENLSDNTSFPKDQILANALKKYSSNQPLSPEEQAAINSLLAKDSKDLEQQILAQIYELDDQKLSEQKKESESNVKKFSHQASYFFEQSSKTFIASEKTKSNSPNFLKLRAEIDKFQQEAFNCLNQANIYELRARALELQQQAKNQLSNASKAIELYEQSQQYMDQADKLQQQFNEISELQQQFTSSKNSRFIKQIQTKGAKLIQQVEQFKLSVSELQLPVKFKVSNSKEYNSQEILPNLYKIRLNELKEKTNQLLTQINILPQKSTQININENMNLLNKELNFSKQTQIASTKAHKFKQMQQRTDIKNDPKKLAKAKALQKKYENKANESKQKTEQYSKKLQNQLNQSAKSQQNIEQQKPLKKFNIFAKLKRNKSPKPNKSYKNK